MSRSRWVAIVALVVLALFAAGLKAAFDISEHAHQRDEVANAYAQSGDGNIVAECVFILRSMSFQCDVTPPDAEGDQRTAYYDLQAQQNVAVYTWIAAAAAAFSVIVSGVAVWLVYLTLGEARSTTNAAIAGAEEAKRQADIAEEAFRRLERPYLLPKVLETHQLSARDLQAGVTFTLANYGKTPAITEQIFAELVPMSKLRFKGSVPVIADDANITERYEIVPVGGELNNAEFAPLEGGNPGNEPIVLHCHIVYRDPSRSATYTHHFTLHRLGSKPFRLGYSEHETHSPEYTTQGG